MGSALAQHRQSPDVVDVGIGEEHAADRRTARRTRVQRYEGFDLLGDVGRAVEEQPAFTVGAYRQTRLRAARRAAGARLAAVKASAVPLRHAAAGGRTQDPNDHARRATSATSSEEPSRNATTESCAGLSEQAGSVRPASPASK